MDLQKIEIKSDIFGILSIGLAISSIFISRNLSQLDQMFAILLFAIGFFSYLGIILIKSLNEHVTEINDLNEKINIYKDISDLKAKVELLMRCCKMNKRGQGEIIEIFIRIIQILVIILAGYLILKALGRI